MESDPSLIEISGEDDSLLQKIPNDDVSSVAKNFTFSCSPLQVPGSNLASIRSLPSPIEGKMGNEDMKKPSFSSHREGINKENINTSKGDVPKLNVEPQQMKRKKKGGGYNLRKSLAWDRAFFTEEGVLDPLELSMISSGFSKSSGEMLSVIHEEGRESLSGVLDCESDSADLQALENNLFKELPLSAINGERKMGSALPSKHDSPARANATPTSVAKRKVLSAHDVNRSGSRHSGCPRPVASSSLKRPATVNMTKTATKESKLPKILVTKPLSMTAKSATLGTSYVKHNQIAQPANLQKNGGLKSSSSNTKSARNKAKAIPDAKTSTAKSSIQQARRNVANSALDTQSSSKSQRPPVTVANNSLEVVPGPVLSAANNSSSDHAGGSNKIVVSLPQNAHYVGGSLQHAKIQTAKPSGLRMPSPSLGFFCQPKASASHSQLQRSTQPPNSSIPNLRKLGSLNPKCELRRPPVPGKIPKLMSDVSTNGNIRVLSLNPGCTGPSTADLSSHEKIKSNLEIIHVQNMGVRVPYEPKDCEKINNQKQLHSIPDDVEKQKLEQAEDSRIKNDNTMILEDNASEQLKKANDTRTVANDCPNSRDPSGGEFENPQFTSQLSDAVKLEGVSGTNIMIDHQHEDKQYNSLIENHERSSESQSRDAPGYGSWSTSKVHDDCSSNGHDLNELSGKQADLQNSCTSEVDPISNESRRLQTNSGALFQESESSENFQKYDSADVVDVNPKVQYCSASELDMSHVPSLSKCTEEAVDNANGGNNVRKSQVGDAQVQSLNGNLSVESGNGALSTSAEDYQYSMVADNINENFAEKPELSNPHLLVQQVFQDNNGSNLNDCLWQGKGFSFQESQQGVLQDRKSVVPEESDTCGSISTTMQDCGLGMAETVECLHLEDAPSSSTDNEPVVENYNYFNDTHFSYDFELHGQANSLKLESSLKKSNDQITGTITSCKVVVTNVSPKSGRFSGNEFESPHFMSQLSPAVQVTGGSGIDDMIQHEDAKDKKSDSSVKYNYVVSDLQPGVDISYCHQGTPIVQNDWSCTHEVDRQSLEESTADVSSKVKVSGRSGLESPHGISQDKCRDQANKADAAVNNIIKRSLEEDAQLQSLSQYTVFADDENKQPGEHPELQDPSLISEQFPQDSQGFCLNGLMILNNTYSEESKKTDVLESVSDVSTETAIAMQDGIDVEKTTGHSHVEDVISCCINIAQSVEDLKSSFDMKFGHGSQIRGQAALSESDSSLKISKDQISGGATTCQSEAFCSSSKELWLSPKSNQTLSSESVLQGVEVDALEKDMKFGHGSQIKGQAALSESDSSLKISKDQISGGATTCQSEAFCSSTKELGLSPKSNQTLSSESVLQGVEVDALEKNILPEEVENHISQKSNIPDCEPQHELDNAMRVTEDKDSTISLKKSGIDGKQDGLVIKPPLNVVPFSDEWLAAIEAAGEEILTIKSGPVQNSPPDKSLPEPGPWSPVRRKGNQEIGPFDCTKITNSNILPSSSH